MVLITAESLKEVEVIPTGFSNLDTLTGIGGIPVGRITEVFGDSQVGKSTLCMQLVADALRQGFRCLWADVEYSYGALYSQNLGVDNKKLLILRDECAEPILDAIEEGIRAGEYDLVVIDSIGGLLPRAEAEKGAEGKVIGGQAKLIATFCRKLVPLLVTKQAALVVINHSFIDLMSNKVMTSGGKKLDYHKSLSIRLKKAHKQLLQGDTQVGEIITATVWKNKLAATLKQETDLQAIWGQGFNKMASLQDAALAKGVITKRGQTYYLGEEKLVVGLPKLRTLFQDTSFSEKVTTLLNGTTT